MIAFQEIKNGDYVLVNNEGTTQRGEVINMNKDEKQVCVNNGVQDFWYEVEDLGPITINEDELQQLKFGKEINDNGSVKYSKGAFRMLIPAENDFSRYELWYRDETRHIPRVLYVHQLQNHFYEMTKMHLNDASFK